MSRVLFDPLKDTTSVADLGKELARGGGDGVLPVFWVKKQEIKEGRKAGWASKTKASPTNLVQGRDLPLHLKQNYL